MLRFTAILLLVVLTWNSKQFNAEEVPLRYDGDQLWRLSNINNATLIRKLEDDFGGDIWNEHPEGSLNIAIDREHLVEAKQFLTSNNVQVKVLHSNIQERIDEERRRGMLMRRSGTRSDWNSGMNWEKYHYLDVIYGFLEDVNSMYPEITKLYTIGKTKEGRELKVLRISENPEKYKKIWIDGGVHAREWIAPAAVTYALMKLVTNWKDQPKELKKLTWYFMPVVNPDGYAYTHKFDRKWRKNRAKTYSRKCVGVDINRNFPIGWGVSASDPCSGSYRGASSGSELETRAIMRFLRKNKSNFEGFISFHSYSQYIMYPYAYKKAKAKNYRKLQDLAEKMAKRIRKETGTRYKVGQSTTLMEYDGIGGTLLDFGYARLGANLSFAVELRDEGAYGFLLPAYLIIPSGNEAFIIMKTMAEAI